MTELSTSEAANLLLQTLSLLGSRADRPRPIVLAVSGGPDSLALLCLAVEARATLEAAGFILRAATVDHRLRHASADEAAGVAALCAALGVPHATLPWLSAKPSGNLAAAARDARYDLLLAHAEASGAGAILTAHHEDDQIETHFLAAVRGAGDRGLAGMRAKRAMSPDVALLRPFLGVPGAALKAAVACRGVACVDDPANRDPRFHRARLRASLRLVPEERRAVLARIAGHAARRDGDDAALGAWLRPLHRTGALAVDARGALRVQADACRSAPSETFAAFLARALPAAGGAPYPPARARIEALSARVRDAGLRAATLGGAAIRREDDSFTFFREYRRASVAPVDVPGVCAPIFDRRFKCFAFRSSDAGEGTEIVAFGAIGNASAIHRTLPVLVSGNAEVIAAHPALCVKRLRGAAELVSQELVGFRLLADLP